MPKKYIDKKVTVWLRLGLHDNTDMSEVVRMAESGTPIRDMLNVDVVYGIEILSETEECLIDDEGREVVQVYENDKLLWENG